jgi:hypothetical protein
LRFCLGGFRQARDPWEKDQFSQVIEMGRAERFGIGAPVEPVTSSIATPYVCARLKPWASHQALATMRPQSVPPVRQSATP